MKKVSNLAWGFLRPLPSTVQGSASWSDPLGCGTGLVVAVPPENAPKIITFLLVAQLQLMIAHFFQLDQRNNFYFTHFFLKPIFNPLGVETLSKWGKIVNLVTFLLVVRSQLMMAHFFQLNEWNNFYLKHFLLKSIFTLLEGVVTPELGKSK